MFPRKHTADSLSLSKVAAHVKPVMTHGPGFGSCLKIAEGLVNHRKTEVERQSISHVLSLDDSGWSIASCLKARFLQATCCQVAGITWYKSWAATGVARAERWSLEDSRKLL